MTWIEAIPAYGREYESQIEVRADWDLGRDFRVAATGQYLNKHDADSLGLKVIIRYDSLRKIVNV